MTHTFSEALRQYPPLIQEFLRSYFPDSQASLPHPYPFDDEVFSRFADFSVRGKMFRGALLLSIVSTLCEGEMPAGALPIAAGLELVGSALLIQDDVMDRDQKRRSRPTIHQQLTELGHEQGLVDAQHFGESAATCVGDLGLFMGLGLLAKASPESVGELLETTSYALSSITLGQIEDLRLGSALEATEEQILTMHKGKTAHYTSYWPIKLALILSRDKALLTPETEAKILSIAEKIGVLFQLVDDQLGFIGSESETGKSTSSDILQNKKTLYWLYLLQQSSDVQRQRLDTIFGNPHASDEDIAWVKQLSQDLGVTAEVDRFIMQKRRAVETELEELLIPTELRTLLLSVLAFVTERQK